jgi:hypothetical protein
MPRSIDKEYRRRTGSAKRWRIRHDAVNGKVMLPQVVCKQGTLFGCGRDETKWTKLAPVGDQLTVERPARRAELASAL